MLDRWLESLVPASHWSAVPVRRTPLFRSILAGIPSGEHFSPAENLEQLDLAALGSAKQSIHLSMYAFTDLRLAHELIDRARQGVIVRIYRDGEQFEQEQERSSRYGWVTPTTLFYGHPNIHIRVKPPSRQFIQHLNYVDEVIMCAPEEARSSLPCGQPRVANIIFSWLCHSSEVQFLLPPITGCPFQGRMTQLATYR